MKALYKAVVFDLDGTLTDSQRGIVRSVQYALEQLHRPVPSAESLRFFVGPPLMDSFVKIGVPEELLQTAVDHFQDRYARVGYLENGVYPGIARMLGDLKQAGLYLAVATAKPERFAIPILEHFGIAGWFNRICGRNAEGMDTSKKILIESALPSGQIDACVVGDRCYDMDGARAVGVDGIGALWGCGTREELLRSGARHLVETPLELRNLLLGGEN